MSPQVPSPDYKGGTSGCKSATDSATVEEFVLLLARAIRQFHTYPTTSPICGEAIAACGAALTRVDRAARLALRVTPHELLLDDVGIGAGTIIEHEIVRRLHGAGVATLDIDPGASPRDLAHLCEDVLRCDGLPEDVTFADLLVEHGVEAIAARMGRRPEVLNRGVPPTPLRDLVDHDQRRRRATPPTGPVDYLYPPEKGWIRLDPSVDLETVSLVDLALLVNDPGEMAGMLLRLTDDDPVGEVPAEQALEEKFGDVAMLFSALDPHLARVMFSKLARAVLSIDEDRRTALLRRTILPGLLDGRAAGSVLRDFPDPDLAESLCLLLELDTAAPEVVGAALNRLELTAERRHTVATLVGERLRDGGSEAARAHAGDQSVDRYARRLIAVDAAAARDFSELSAFDLSIDQETAVAIAGVAPLIASTDTALVQLDCLRQLVHLEPNPTPVQAFLRRAMDLLGELHADARWDDVAAVATRFRRLTYELQPSRPDVAAAISAALGAHWTRHRVTQLLALNAGDPDARAAVRALVEAFGTAMAPGFLAALVDASPEAQAVAALLCEHALLLAPELAARVDQSPAVVARVVVRVLGVAGSGYERAIAEQLTRGDEQLTRAALRALAHIGTSRAAALVAFHIHTGSPVSRAAEEALWHFPRAQATLQIRDLLSRRDFVMHNPGVVGRLIDRAAQWDACDLGGVLEELEALRFRVWNPDLVRIARKARGLRGR